MNRSLLNPLRLTRPLLVQAVVAFILATSLTALIMRWHYNPQPVSGGFDFSARREGPASGPLIGDRIDLAIPKERNGRTLAEAVRGSSFCMIAIVDPHCAACKAATGQMRGIDRRLRKPGVPYFVLMLSDSSDTASYFQYASSLGVGSSEAFVWSMLEAQAPSSLSQMVVPSHLLLSKDGIVVNKWPGTHQDPVVRQQMVNQITTDVIEHLRTSG